MIDLTTQQKIKQILSSWIDLSAYKVFIFGSWATQTYRKSSDIDIGIEGQSQIPLSVMGNLQTDFEESDLPFTVDIVDFSMVDAKFKQIAKKKVININ